MSYSFSSTSDSDSGSDEPPGENCGSSDVRYPERREAPEGDVKHELRECGHAVRAPTIHLNNMNMKNEEERDAKTQTRPRQSRPIGPLGTEIKANVRFSWVNPKLQPRMCETGSGMYAMEDVKKGETLILWTGRILDAEQALYIMETEDRHYILQVGDRWYQVPLSEEREAADWTNHSCDPNAGFGKNSPVELSAMRDIAAGEQVCFDYGMCETDARLWEPMDCCCGSKYCRGKITVDDWKIPELRERYKGFFSPHVQRLIDEEAGHQKTTPQPKVVKKRRVKRIGA